MKNKIGIVSIASVVVLITNFVGGHYAMSVKNDHIDRPKAERKADTNNNGKLEVDEVLRVYKQIGLNCYEITQKIGNAARNHLIGKLLETEHGAKRYSDLIQDMSNSRLLKLKSDLLPQNYNPLQDLNHTHYPPFISTLEYMLIDTDDSGMINVAEAEMAFRLAYENSNVELDLDCVSKNTRESFTRMLLWPYARDKDSELERYLESDEAELQNKVDNNE